MYDESLERLCLPEPPTPSQRAFPNGCLMHLLILAT